MYSIGFNANYSANWIRDRYINLGLRTINVSMLITVQIG